MPVSIIPFNMPEPAEIPSHIIDSLKSMPPDEAVAKGMELLMQIEAADTMVYERVSEGGAPELGHVAGAGGIGDNAAARRVHARQPAVGRAKSAAQRIVTAGIEDDEVHAVAGELHLPENEAGAHRLNGDFPFLLDV